MAYIRHLVHRYTRNIGRNYSSQSKTNKIDLSFLDLIWSDMYRNSVTPVSTLYDVVILKSPGDIYLRHLCDKSNKIVCSDGGSNALLHSGSNRSPTAMVGDFKSVTPKLEKHYLSKGTYIKRTCIVHVPYMNLTFEEKGINF